jgi:hypothetical protein
MSVYFPEVLLGLDQDLNPNLCCERPGTNFLSCGTVIKARNTFEFYIVMQASPHREDHAKNV